MSEPNGAPDEKPAPSMQVSVQRISEVEQRLDVQIPWEEAKGRLDEAYDELRKGVTIKGFRKGKVPRRMLEQMFGKHVIKEVAQRLVQESIGKALQDNEIVPVSEPKVEDDGIIEGKSFTYTASLQVVPEIEPNDYFDVDVVVRPAQVTDEAVELALKYKQQEMTDYQTVEGRSTQTGDVLLVDVMGKAGSRPIDLEQELVELGEPEREPIEGLAEALTGIPCDQNELELELEVSTEGGQKEKARLLVTIHEVRKKVVPQLDDDFAKDTGEAQTLDELRDVIRKKLLAEDRDKARDEAKEQLVKTIIERNEIPVVPALVERHLDRRVALQKALFSMQGGTGALDEDALKEHMRQDARDAVKRALILAAIAKKEHVEVADADVEKRLAEIATSRGQNVARVRSEYEKEGMLDSLKERIAEDKTLDLLMGRANIKEEESSGDSEALAENPVENGEGSDETPGLAEQESQPEPVKAE